MNGTVEGWTELFRYDRWATERVLETLERHRPRGLDLGASSAPLVRAGRLMAHLVRAQAVWLARVRGESEETVLWPAWPRTGGRELARETSDSWRAYLGALSDADLREPVAYRNSKGTPFVTRLDVILQHVVNHGTHHRAQVLEALRQAGIERPPLDFIVFVREEDAGVEGSRQVDDPSDTRRQSTHSTMRSPR